MSVKGGVFDIQLMHAAWLCLCSHTELLCVPFGEGGHNLRPAGCIPHLKVNNTQCTQKCTVISNRF